MSADRQEELTGLLERALELEALAELEADPRLKRIHYDWLNAGEATQRTVARLSEQLRRYLDDQAWFENRRIMSVIRARASHNPVLRRSPRRSSQSASCSWVAAGFPSRSFWHGQSSTG